MIMLMALPCGMQGKSNVRTSLPQSKTLAIAPAKTVSYAARLLENKVKIYQRAKNEQALLKTLQQGVTKYPEDIFFIYTLADYYADQNKLDDALQLVDQLIAKDANNKDYVLNKVISMKR